MVAIGFVRSTLALKNEAIAFHLVSGNIVSLGSIIWIWAVSLWGRTLRWRLQSINEINIETTNLLHFLPNELVGVDLPLKDSVIGVKFPVIRSRISENSYQELFLKVH